MEGKYKIYRITAPDGCQYIGWTGMTVEERWRNHVKRAVSGDAKEHPFYNAILQYGEDSFMIEELYAVNTREEALLLEEKCIADVPREKSYNLSSGGINDASEGGRIFWERMNADPEKKEQYLRKLSARKLADDWVDYDALLKANQEWRKANPREAYRLSYRAIRIANKKKGYPPPWQDRVDNRPLKERLMHKFRMNEVKSEYVRQIWDQRTDTERREIGKKISNAQKANMAAKTDDERRQITAKARASIDREKQGQAASSGLKQWWADLRKEPERYQEYIQRRIDSRKANRHENI